jgi:hypothetical protein
MMECIAILVGTKAPAARHVSVYIEAIKQAVQGRDLGVMNVLLQAGFD